MTDTNSSLINSQLPTAHIGGAIEPRFFEPHELSAVQANLGKLAVGEPVTGNERLIEGWQAATHDALMPQMLNRKGLTEWFERYRPENAGVMLLDIKGFKTLNDTYGQKIGDDILKNVGSAFMQHLRIKEEEPDVEKRKANATDIIAQKKDEAAARYGGDEFIAVINLDKVEEKDRENVMQQIAERMTNFDEYDIGENNKVPISIRSVYHISNDPTEAIDSIYEQLSPKLVQIKHSEKV